MYFEINIGLTTVLASTAATSDSGAGTTQTSSETIMVRGAPLASQ